MSKALGSWSGMRKYLEQEMLCDALKGRVRYNRTTYPNMDERGLFEIYVDKKRIMQFSWETIGADIYKESDRAFWPGFWEEKLHTPLSERKEFEDEEFAEALKCYRALSIGDALQDVNPLVRMFAILDRRVGKRTLERIKDTVDDQQEWLQYFYRLRLDAENIG